MKIGQITQLENLLVHWENRCLIMEGGYAQGLAENGYSFTKEYFHYAPEFRSYLAHSFGQPFDGRFIPEEIPDDEGRQTSDILPVFFHAWVNSSKRIYHLDKFLANMFLATSLKKVDCEDLHFPFGSFALTLEQPITDMEGNSFDCLLFADSLDLYGKKYLSILLLDIKWKSVKLMDQSVTDKIRWAIRKKRWNKIDKKIKQYDFDLISNRPNIKRYYIARDLWTGDITQFVQQYRSLLIELDHDDKFWLRVFKILMGVCFFFQNMPNIIKKVQINPVCLPGAQSKDPEADKLFKTSQIFTFAHERIISQKEREAFSQLDTDYLTGTAKSPHFRSGHWRRPPGYGQDPNCPKTIWVRPCLINADQLKNDQLPLGSKNILE